MKLAFELPPAQSDQLRQDAQRLGVPVDELARAMMSDLLSTPDADFDAAARRILAENSELYRRLA